MANNEYKLSYTAQEIDEKLGQISIPDWEQNDLNGEGYIQNRPFYSEGEGSKLILPQSDIIDGEVQYGEVKFNQKLIAGETYNITFKLISVNSDESHSATVPIVAKQFSDIIRESEGTIPEGFNDFVAFYQMQTLIEFEGYDRTCEVIFLFYDNVTASSASENNPVLADGIASYVLINRDIPEGYEFTVEIDDDVEVVHKLDTKFINTTDKISEIVTNEELPTAKAVYDYVDSRVGTDWAQNDPQGEGYIKNRPFYSEGSAITFESTDGNTAVIDSTFELIVGQSYGVSFTLNDGSIVSQTLVAKTFNETTGTNIPNGDKIICIGPNEYFGLFNNCAMVDKEPVYVEGSAIYMLKYCVSATLNVGKIKTIDPIYLPDYMSKTEVMAYVAEQIALLRAELSGGSTDTNVIEWKSLSDYKVDGSSSGDYQEYLDLVSDTILTEEQLNKLTINYTDEDGQETILSIDNGNCQFMSMPVGDETFAAITDDDGEHPLIISVPVDNFILPDPGWSFEKAGTYFAVWVDTKKDNRFEWGVTKATVSVE